MRKLAGTSRQVPRSYLVDTFLGYRVEKTIIAIGGFADIRKGRFKGRDVAVKTIRTSQESNIDAIHEVRKAFRYDISSLTVDQHEIPDPGLLQGVCSLDEHVSS